MSPAEAPPGDLGTIKPACFFHVLPGRGVTTSKRVSGAEQALIHEDWAGPFRWLCQLGFLSQAKSLRAIPLWVKCMQLKAPERDMSFAEAGNTVPLISDGTASAATSGERCKQHLLYMNVGHGIAPVGPWCGVPCTESCSQGVQMQGGSRWDPVPCQPQSPQPASQLHWSILTTLSPYVWGRGGRLWCGSQILLGQSLHFEMTLKVGRCRGSSPQDPVPCRPQSPRPASQPHRSAPSVPRPCA